MAINRADNSPDRLPTARRRKRLRVIGDNLDEYPNISGPLSSRENEILEILTGPGRTDNWAIGKRIGIAESTVKSHMTGIINKLGVHDRTGAAVKAIREGIVEQPDELKERLLREGIINTSIQSGNVTVNIIVVNQDNRKVHLS